MGDICMYANKSLLHFYFLISQLNETKCSKEIKIDREREMAREKENCVIELCNKRAVPDFNFYFFAT